LAATRAPIDAAQFVTRLGQAGIEGPIAQFIWDEFQPYDFAPLTPYPEDRPITEMRIDGDDLSDIVVRFEKQFRRRWRGKWIGPKDSTLAEFAKALVDSTSEL
jgi:hypothetical protein